MRLAFLGFIAGANTMRFVTFSLFISLAAAAVAENPPAEPAEKQTGRSPPAKADEANDREKSLDDELLDDLTGDLLDDLGGDPRQPAKGAADSGEASPDPSDDELLQQLGEGEDIGQEGGPLVEIGRNMRKIESLLAERRSGDETQKIQEQVIATLARLIEVKRQQSQSQDQNQQNKPQDKRDQRDVKQPMREGDPMNPQNSGERTPNDQNPANDSEQRLDPSKVAQAALESRMELQRQVWGTLPKHLQEAVRNASSEVFLQKYEEDIKKYFTRLAEMYQNR